MWHLVGLSYPYWITMHGQPHISRMKVCCEISVAQQRTTNCTFRIWHQAIFICLRSWSSICHNIVSTAMKMSNALPSCEWHNRDIFSYTWRWTILLHAMTSVSTIQGVKFTNGLPVAPSFYIAVSLLKHCHYFKGTVNLLSDPPSH